MAVKKKKTQTFMYLSHYKEPTKQLNGAESFLRSEQCSVSQEIPHLLWNSKVQNIPSLIPILSHMNPVHNLTPHFSNIISSNFILSSVRNTAYKIR
jgi:hypothetical protein